MSTQREDIYNRTDKDVQVFVCILLFIIPNPSDPSKLVIRSEIVPEWNINKNIRNRTNKKHFYQSEKYHSPRFKIKDNDRIRVDDNINGCYICPKDVKRKCITYCLGGNSNYYEMCLIKNNSIHHKEDVSITYTRDNNHEVIHVAVIGSMLCLQKTIFPELDRLAKIGILGHAGLWTIAKRIPSCYAAGLARDLGVKEENIQEIKINFENDRREQVYKLLLFWTHMDTEASTDDFTKALRANDLGFLAEVIQSAYQKGIYLNDSIFTIPTFEESSIWTLAKRIPVERATGLARDLGVQEEMIQQIISNKSCESEKVCCMLRRWTLMKTPDINTFLEKLEANKLGDLIGAVETAFRRGIKIKDEHFVHKRPLHLTDRSCNSH